MYNINRFNSIVNFIDYTPLSPITNLVLLFLSCFPTTDSDVPTTQPTPQHSFTAIHERSTIERVILLVPFLGCIVIALYDLSLYLSQSKLNSHQDIDIGSLEGISEEDKKFLKNIPQELIKEFGYQYFINIPERSTWSFNILPREMEAPIMRQTLENGHSVLFFTTIEYSHDDQTDPTIKLPKIEVIRFPFLNGKLQPIDTDYRFKATIYFFYTGLTPFIVNRLKRLMKFESVGSFKEVESLGRPEDAYLSEKEYSEFIKHNPTSNLKLVYEQKTEKDVTGIFLYDPKKTPEENYNELNKRFPKTPFLKGFENNLQLYDFPTKCNTTNNPIKGNPDHSQVFEKKEPIQINKDLSVDLKYNDKAKNENEKTNELELLLNDDSDEDQTETTNKQNTQLTDEFPKRQIVTTHDKTNTLTEEEMLDWFMTE